MKLMMIILTLLIIQFANADSSRLRYSFKSSNGYFELRPSDTLFSDNKVYSDTIQLENNETYISTYTYPDHYYWGLYDVRTNEKLYTIKNEELFIEFKTALISDDGKYIVIIDDYSGGIALPCLEVVHFYEADKLVKTLNLGDLLGNMCSTSYSISHMMWCSKFKFNQENNFEIDTYDFYHYTFDLKGNLIEKKSDERIKPTDDIIVAKIKRLEKNQYSFNILMSIRNKYPTHSNLVLNIPDKTMRKVHGKFYGFLPSKNKKMETEFNSTVLLKNGNSIVPNFGVYHYNSYFSCDLLNKETCN
jgi:hypothetical protein